ncbi:NGFI-A-binding protein 2 isoform X2 [Rhinatrema bivittatum]|uniref:NGFI-A-binding protein 2 isoform X2 n=1 Tax=Rhinatrema bivittatum TaxID=194408 RepID=UPI00112D88F2|nr:NGFI-A-binding protein 2 isoform X2 [Rhinatrema bivittatum]
MQKKSSLPAETTAATARTEDPRRAAKPRSSTDLTTMSLPRTLGELQLYRVLQRANLLSYYETFIQQGGDDVQQLCEAGEEEFLEIMSLVGMATKPLHVRRLQKALREWATNPALFNQPVASIPVSSIPLFKISETGGRKSISNGHGNSGDNLSKGFRALPSGSFSPRSPSDHGEKLSPLQVPQDARLWHGRNTPEPDGFLPEDEGACLFPPVVENPEKLDVDMVRTISESVDRLMKSFPQSEPAEARSLLKLNKKLAKSVGHIFEMGEQDGRKEEEIRKFSIIYGRFDSKRREGKQLTLHELTINEAAAQFCMRDNTLLLRRVELFSLSRQVARESMYLTTLKCSRLHPDDTGAPQPKKLKQEVVEQGPAESLQLAGCDPYAPVFRANVEEDTGSLSGESLDGHFQAVGSCVRLTPSPVPTPEVPLSLSVHGPWSRHILQQTLMDEGLRLARLVSHDRLGRLSPCKPQISELEDSTLECQSISSPPTTAELQRGTSKGDQETSRQ